MAEASSKRRFSFDSSSSGVCNGRALVEHAIRGVSALPASCELGHCVPLPHLPSVTAPDVSNEADGCNPRATRSSHVRPSWMPATLHCSIIVGLDSCVSIVPGPVNNLCRVDVGHDECSCQGVRFLMLRIRPVSTRCIRRTGHAWRRHAAHVQKPSLVPMNQQFEQTLSLRGIQGKPDTMMVPQDTCSVATRSASMSGATEQQGQHGSCQPK